jgi:hypothetical protein
LILISKSVINRINYWNQMGNAGLDNPPPAVSAGSKGFLVTTPDARQFKVTGVATGEEARTAVEEWLNVGPDLQQKRQAALAGARGRIALTEGMWLSGILLVAATILYGTGRALRYIFAGPGQGAWWN